MLPRLIATDLAGTLLNSRGDLSGRTIAALRAAHDPLFGFALATDRGFTQEAGFIERMPVHHGDDLMVSHMGTEAVELGPAGAGVRRRDQRPGDVRVRRPVSRRANAPPLVRATATPVTESNDDAGVALVIEALLAEQT